MKIEICSPVPNGGEDLFNLLVESAASLASGEHQIEVKFTCHSNSQRLALLDSRTALNVSGSYIVEREEPLYFHANSVTHSRCVNVLFSAVEADLAVICDFDIAFALRNWDRIVVDEVINNNIAFLGTPYSVDAELNFALGNTTVLAKKYQQKPNCMFIAFSPTQLRPITDRLCRFASTYGPNSRPLKLISNSLESRQYGLPIGSFLHVDTGSLIPEIIEQHGLRQSSFVRSVKDYKVLRSARFPSDYPRYLLPEEYFYNERPIIAHYRKGSSKSTDGEEPYARRSFIHDIRSWLDMTKEESLRPEKIF